jgi:7-cyano-7-deazaguanine synthase
LKKKSAIVLVSGGLDSCVATAVAAVDHSVSLLHCTYGQRTADREWQAFESIARHYEAETRVVDLSYLGQMGGSSLTDRTMVVESGVSDPDIVPTTYVPFRNSHLLSVAVSWAEVSGSRSIFIGAVESDSAGYPDCRSIYFAAFNRLIQLGTRRGDITVETPLIGMKKAEIIRLGRKLNAPLHLTWSCYIRSELACGRCESCTLRRRGFDEAGERDPIPYAEAE